MKAEEEIENELTVVVATSRNGVIGKDGDLPWREPEDLKHFKRITMGHALILGRRTWDSIGRPLPGRRMIVVSRNSALELPEGVERAFSLDEALALARQNDPAPCLIGGAELYAQGLPRATRIELTHIERDVAGDTFFPALDEEAWREIESRASEGLTFRTLVRIAADREVR